MIGVLASFAAALIVVGLALVVDAGRRERAAKDVVDLAWADEFIEQLRSVNRAGSWRHVDDRPLPYTPRHRRPRGYAGVPGMTPADADQALRFGRRLP